MPTVRSFLSLFRMLSVYYPTREITRNRENVDQLEQMKLLTTYEENMIVDRHRFK